MRPGTLRYGLSTATSAAHDRVRRQRRIQHGAHGRQRLGLEGQRLGHGVAHEHPVQRHHRGPDSARPGDHHGWRLQTGRHQHHRSQHHGRARLRQSQLRRIRQAAGRRRLPGLVRLRRVRHQRHQRDDRSRDDRLRHRRDDLGERAGEQRHHPVLQHLAGPELSAGGRGSERRQLHGARAGLAAPGGIERADQRRTTTCTPTRRAGCRAWGRKPASSPRPASAPTTTSATTSSTTGWARRAPASGQPSFRTTSSATSTWRATAATTRAAAPARRSRTPPAARASSTAPTRR